MAESTFHDKTFAEQVKWCREARGMSQAALAKALVKRGLTNYHQQTIAKIERGTRRVPLGDACTIADVLCVSLASMVGFARWPAAEHLARIAVLEQAVAAAQDTLNGVSS